MDDQNMQLHGTTVHSPALNWSQVRETEFARCFRSGGQCLGALRDLVPDLRRLHSPKEWCGLQEKTRSRNSMREEIAMFDTVIRGVPIQEAIAPCMAEKNQKSDDIELF